MKLRISSNNFSQILVYGCCALIFVLLLFTWWELHFKTPKIWTVLDETGLPSKFPLSEASREQLIENSDIHFKYHNSLTTVLSLIIAALGILLTFAAFYIQYVFNYRQKVDLSKERFENQFFHLLDVSRDICQNIYIPNVGKGKLAFHYMFYEYKAIYNLILKRGILKTNDPEIINKVAFCIFINGVSYGFKPDIDSELIDEDVLVDLVDHLLKLQANSEGHGENGIVDSGVVYIKDYKERHIKYFDGHRLRLIHYFNYILLILNHIYESEKDKNKRDMDMMMYLCGELSEHELGLLYSYTYYRKDWDNDKYGFLLERLLLNSETIHKFKFDTPGFIPASN